jgi:ubiquinone/menaquinone biosynthesis C-methylase UbiE
MATDLDARCERIIATFNQAASGYDNEALRFFVFCADRLLVHLHPAPGQKLLDIATGTGAVALAAAQAVGRQGRVAAVDLSEAMLARLEAKIETFNLSNIDIHVMDAGALEFRRDYFDHAVCSFGLFFMSDMAAALRQWLRVIKPGGKLAFTAFGPQAFQPQMQLFFEALAHHGIAPDDHTPLAAAQRLHDPEYCRSLLSDAGLSETVVHKEQLGYHLKDINDWWTVVWNSGLRGWVERLPNEARADFQSAHLADVDKLKTPDGLWFNVETHFAVGRKPAL